MWKTIIIIALVIAAITAGIVWYVNKSKVMEGTVINKWYEPARTYIMLMPMKVGDITMMMPYIFYDDEDFIVRISGFIENTTEIDTRDIYLTKAFYDKVKVGNWFTIKDNNCETSDPQTKRRK